MIVADHLSPTGIKNIATHKDRRHVRRAMRCELPENANQPFVNVTELRLYVHFDSWRTLILADRTRHHAFKSLFERINVFFSQRKSRSEFVSAELLQQVAAF